MKKLVQAAISRASVGLGLEGDSLYRRQVRGESLYLRRNTPDLKVARQTLGPEFEMLKRLFPPDFDGLFVDAGGYIGTAAIRFARLYPRATVVTIEPSTVNYRVLERNVAPLAAIKPLKAALVGAGSGQVRLRNRGTGTWGFTIVDTPLDRPDAPPIDTVPGITLAQISEMHGGRPIRLLKLDIEGGEKAILEQDAGLIPQIDVIMAELHDRIVEGCTAAFDAATQGRWNLRVGGEKVLSLRRG